MFTAIGNTWVMDAPHYWKVWRACLMICVVLLTFTGIGVWIAPHEASDTHSPYELSLVYKDSPVFDSKTRARLTQTIEDFVGYLSNLGVEIKTPFSPIAFRTDLNGSGGYGPQVFTSAYPAPYYATQIILTSRSVADPKQLTSVISAYVIGQLTYDPRYFNGDLETTFYLGTSLESYFEWSYWGYKGPNEGGARWGDALWLIRERFGKDFGDRFATFVLRAGLDRSQPPNPGLVFEDIPPPGPGAAPTPASVKRFMYNAFYVADAVVDNEQQKWPEIQKILSEQQLGPVTRP